MKSLFGMSAVVVGVTAATFVACGGSSSDQNVRSPNEPRAMNELTPAQRSETQKRAATEDEREREAAVVGRLRQEAHSGRRGVIGLAPTLDALNERRVERLVVSAGYAEEGWRCPASGILAAVGPRSPVDGRRMDRVTDVVADALHAAIGQGCRVDICTGNADLDVMGRIGALLRY